MSVQRLSNSILNADMHRINVVRESGKTLFRSGG